jgi:nucleoside-diphosphate-sugar epimerase
MKILFVGGTGNISTSCVEWALGRGHEVGILNRGRRPSPFGPEVALLAGDRDEPGTLRQAAAASRWDMVVDFVAFRPSQVDAAVEAFDGRVGQYVFISSASVYQKPPARPVITEDTPLVNPFWEYARQKIACEDRLRAAHRDRGFPVTIVRPSYTYGHTWIPSGLGGQDYTIVDRMRRGLPVVCHGDGTSLWVMTHARDFAVGLGGLLGRTEAIGEAFHVTSDEVLTWSQIYEAMARAAGVEVRLVHVPSALIAALLPERGGSLLGDKAHSAIFDNSKLRRLVPDYRARVTFAAGIAESIAWFDEDPARRVVNPAMTDAIDRVLAAQGRAWEVVPAGAAP